MGTERMERAEKALLVSLPHVPRDPNPEAALCLAPGPLQIILAAAWACQCPARRQHEQ